MTASRSDLLSVTRAIIRGARVFSILMIVLLSIILVALLIRDADTLTLVASSTIPPDQRVFAARVGVAGALLNCVLLLPLLTHLLRLVDSARQGDPFVPENGARLRRIGWLLLAVNVITNITVSIALTKGVMLPPVSFVALLTVLMIFVLARIFETGSAMRAELKETV